MPKAIWNGVVLAESDDTVIVEGNHYFPPDAVNHDYFEKSEHSTICPWKGKASYYTIKVNGDVNDNAAWTYASPKPAAREIANRIAFWHGVRIE